MQQSKKNGLTKIELLVAIILLNILMFIAIPRFLTIRAHAYQATVDNAAGVLNSASEINYMSCSAKRHMVSPGQCTRIAKCSDLTPLVSSTVPMGPVDVNTESFYNIAVDKVVSKNGEKIICTLQFKKVGKVYQQNFVLTGAGL